MKSKLFYFVILSQLALVFFLGFKINQKRKNVLGSVEINPINKENITFKLTGKLKYFYEPKADTNYYLDDYEYNINKDGLRENINYNIEKPTSTIRILTLGDSFTFGLYIKNNKIWSELLEQMLNRKYNNCVNNYEVINLGVQGYDIEYALERYKIKGQKYNPDLILWLHTDFKRIQEKIKSYYSVLNKNAKYNNDSLELWALASEKNYNSISDKDIITYQKKLLDNYAIEAVVPTIMFVLSTQEKYFPIFEKLSQENSKIYSQIIDYGEDLRIPGDYHPSEYGHQVIAQDVYDYLIKNKLVPCN